MDYNSICVEGASVPFPSFEGERLYMLPVPVSGKNIYIKDERLVRWAPTIYGMLEGVPEDYEGTVFFMADQSEVKRGEYHRRPGIHIDGYWDDGLRGHGGHSQVAGHSGGGGHTGGGRWTPIPSRHKPNGSHRWADSTFEEAEAIILATNIEDTCWAWNGEFSGIMGEGGDCSKMQLGGGHSVSMEANRSYHGNVTMMHETKEMPRDVLRTVVRLNVPGYSPTRH